MSYTPAAGTLSVSWVGATAYSKPIKITPGWWGSDALGVFPVGVDSAQYGTTFVTKQQFIDAAGWDGAAASSVRVTLDWEYPLPHATVDASWSGALAYSPPGTPLLAQWVMGTGPAEDQFADPCGFDSAAFGVLSARNAHEIVAPPGFDAHQPSTHAVENKDRYLLAGGVPSKLTWGAASIQNLRRYITPVGINSAKWGAARLQGGVWLLNAYGLQSLRMGTAWASHSPRYVEPVGVPWNFYTRHQVGTHQELNPLGFEATEWGTRIVPESQALYTEGFTNEFGETWVSLGTRYLRPTGFKLHAAEELRFGLSHVWNWQSYYDISTDANDPDFSGEVFGLWTRIENRNKVIAHHSTSPGALPSPKIDNAARPLLPSGIEAPDPGKWEKTADVSHGVRYVHPAPLLSEVVSRWSGVANGARLLRTSGEATEAFGVGSIWNSRRWLSKVGDFVATEWGANRVSPAVTNITFDARYTIGAPVIPLPDVRLNTRYITLRDGIDSYRTGGHHLHIHWNIVYPRWTYDPLHWAGTPDVRNLTPEVRQHGHSSVEFGDTKIRTQWREITTRETYATQFGATKIADRRLWVEPSSAAAPPLSMFHEVFNLDPDPPAVQKIVIDDKQSIGYGPLQSNGGKTWYAPQPVDDHGFGEPSTNAISIFPKWEEDDFDLLGLPVVRLQGVLNATVGYSGMTDPPEPTVWMRVRKFSMRPERADTNDFMVVGRPRLSPHTIWSVVEAPLQAKVNHPVGTTLHYVDEIVVAGGVTQWKTGPGKPTVGHRYRYIQPHHAKDSGTGALLDWATYGTACVVNKDHRVSMEGLNTMKFGRPVMLGGTRTIGVVNNISELDNPELPEHRFGERFGVGFVSNRARTLHPVGIKSTIKFGLPVIDYFHRFIRPSGWFSQAVGEYSGGQNPYQWQRIRVGPLVPNYMEGFDVAEFGEPWVSNFIRDVGVPGFVATETGPVEDGFHLRMLVRRGGVTTPVARKIAPLGVTEPLHGSANLMNLTQYIRPDGDMTNFRKGAPNL